MASYVLFSPQNQPDAWSVAAVLAITLLPFTILGPFVSPLLDKWSRRQVVLISDSIRAVLALSIGATIFLGGTTGAWQVMIFGLLLMAMSLNRFVLAGLSAAMQHTVDEDAYLSASSILPTLGPLGVMIGVAVGALARIGFGSVLEPHQADGVVFFLSCALFVTSVVLARGFSRHALGPDHAVEAKRISQVWGELREAAHHLDSRQPVWLALGVMGSTRLLFGMFSVAVILAARNLFNEEIGAALADVTLWGLLTGVGFVAGTAVVPALARRMGLRLAAISVLALGAVAQLIPAIWPSKPVMFAFSVLLGLSVQSFKIVTDTIVQAHVAESFKGRVFIFYDVLFNACFVLAAVVAALTLPPTGVSATVYAAMAATYLLLAVGFARVSRRLGADRFEKGTQALTGHGG